MVYDDYSTCLYLVILIDKSVRRVIYKLKSVFSEFSCPNELTYDENFFEGLSVKNFYD